MEPINTSLYELFRDESGEVKRRDGLGGESPELTVDYYESQIAFHEQVVANLTAQKEKLEAFERDNPAVESIETYEDEI